MSYIEREAAIEAMYEDAEAHPDHTFWTSQHEALLDIPAADVRPVVHARPVKIFNDQWTGKMFTTCSACDGKIGSKDNFCKHCGAMMEES